VECSDRAGRWGGGLGVGVLSPNILKELRCRYENGTTVLEKTMASSGIASKLRVALGIIVLIVASLTLMSALRDFVLMVRFGGPTGGYIGAANFGHLIFDGGVTLILLFAGGILLRRHLNNRKAQMAAFIVIALAFILGINAGLM
jgi:hypothetical protein